MIKILFIFDWICFCELEIFGGFVSMLLSTGFFYYLNFYMFTANPIPENAHIAYKWHGFTVWNWDQMVFDGSHAVYEWLQRSDFSQVIPVTDDGKIIVLQEEQPWIGEFYGLVWWSVEDGHGFEETAYKEAEEEIGIKINKLEKLYNMSHYACIWQWYCFVTRDRDFSGTMNHDVWEKIKMLYVDFDELMEMINRDRWRNIEFSYRVMKNFLIKWKKEELRKLLLW